MDSKLPEFVKYPDIPYLEGNFNLNKIFKNPPSIYEKLDGSNCQVRRKDWRILPGSKAHYITEHKWEEQSGHKSWMKYFKKWSLGNESLLSLPEDFILYGEWASPEEEGLFYWTSVMNRKYPNNIKDSFFLIDLGILDKHGKLGEIVDYEEAKEFCKSKKLEDIKFFKKINNHGVNKDSLDKIIQSIDCFDKLALGDMEGVVLKDYKSSPQLFYKYLSRECSEIRGLKKTGKEIDASDRFRYSTPQRIEKVRLKLLDNGMPEEKINREIIFDEMKRDIIKESKVKPNKKYLEKIINEYFSEKEKN